MRIAIMQPYFFPYIGYFQLINSVNEFIFLDDVAFIKRGWIHRNRLYFNNKIYLFSIPIKNSSQNKSINETFTSDIEFLYWKKKMFSSLYSFYKKQPFFYEGLKIIEEVLETPFNSIAELAIHSVQAICGFLDMEVPLARSSDLKLRKELKKEQRIIEICTKYDCDTYINPQGGIALYTKDMFSPYGINLKFLIQNLKEYPVYNRIYIPGLSILDAIMCCGKHYTREHLISGYELQEA